MPHTHVTPEEQEALAEAEQKLQSEPSIEEMLNRINLLTTQRDTITEAISKHKKALQRRIGQL